MFMTPEAKETVIINLEAGRIIRMKRTPGKATLVQLDAVKLNGLPC